MERLHNTSLARISSLPGEGMDITSLTFCDDKEYDYTEARRYDACIGTVLQFSLSSADLVEVIEYGYGEAEPSYSQKEKNYPSIYALICFQPARDLLRNRCLAHPR